jgi:hypothetical protein
VSHQAMEAPKPEGLMNRAISENPRSMIATITYSSAEHCILKYIYGA